MVLQVIKWHLWQFLHPIELRMMSEVQDSLFWRQRLQAYVTKNTTRQRDLGWYLCLSTSEQRLSHYDLAKIVAAADAESLWFIRTYIRPLSSDYRVNYLRMTNCADIDRSKCGELTCMFCNPSACNRQVTWGADYWARHTGPRIRANIQAFMAQWKRTAPSIEMKTIVMMHR